MPRWVDPLPALKRRVADEINILLFGWTQEYAASFLDTSQARVSELRHSRLEGFSLDRLVRYLSRLGRDIEITTSKRPGLSVHDHRDPRLTNVANADNADNADEADEAPRAAGPSNHEGI